MLFNISVNAKKLNVSLTQNALRKLWLAFLFETWRYNLLHAKIVWLPSVHYIHGWVIVFEEVFSKKFSNSMCCSKRSILIWMQIFPTELANKMLIWLHFCCNSSIIWIWSVMVALKSKVQAPHVLWKFEIFVSFPSDCQRWWMKTSWSSVQPECLRKLSFLSIWSLIVA